MSCGANGCDAIIRALQLARCHAQFSLAQRTAERNRLREWIDALPFNGHREGCHQGICAGHSVRVGETVPSCRCTCGLAAALEEEYRVKLVALEKWRCLEWPRWCVEEKRKQKVWRERGRLSDGAAVGVADRVFGQADGSRDAVPPVRQGAQRSDGGRQLRSL